MEFKKKTIIGEDNNEPPKDYIGIKSDGKAYEYSYSQRKGIESKSISASSNSGNCQCLVPMIVSGTVENGAFTPGDDAPTWEEAQAHMFQGGLVYLIDIVDGEPYSAFLATQVFGDSIGAPTDEGMLFWENSDSEGGDDYEPQTYTIQGTVNSNNEFTANAGQMSWFDARDNYDNGDTIKLQFISPNTGMTINETVVSWPNDGGAITTNGFTWYELL